MANGTAESFTIRISGKEIQARLNKLEKQVSRLNVSNYIQLTLLLIIIGKQFFF